MSRNPEAQWNHSFVENLSCLFFLCEFPKNKTQRWEDGLQQEFRSKRAFQQGDVGPVEWFQDGKPMSSGAYFLGRLLYTVLVRCARWTWVLCSALFLASTASDSSVPLVCFSVPVASRWLMISRFFKCLAVFSAKSVYVHACIPWNSNP